MNADTTITSAPPAARTTPRVPRWAFLPFIAVAAVHVIALASGAVAIAGPTKLLLMPLLAFAVLVGARGLRSSAPVVILIAAILLSWIGDGAGVFLPFLPTLPMMLLFFGLAHVAYMILFWRHIPQRARLPLWAALFVVWWGAMMAIIFPHAGALAIAVACYGVVLGATATLATRCNRAVIIGALFFLTSDSLLAFKLFIAGFDSPWTSAAVMFTYCIGQGLIAAGALAALRARQRATTPA